MHALSRSEFRHAPLIAATTLAMLLPALACRAAPAASENAASPASNGSQAVPGAVQQAQGGAPPITPEEAKDHIGEKLTVCGRVALAAYVQDRPRRPTYLNFGRPYPDQAFSVIIRDGDRDRFPEPPETLFADQDVCVTGTVVATDTTPQMRIDDPANIVIKVPGS